MKYSMLLSLLIVIEVQLSALDAQEIRTGEMAGYLIIPNQRVPESFDAGFSMYVAAWPLLQQYPGQRFQSGLPGTWMFAKPSGRKVKDLYSDIEGGLGWWRDTEYATETPKFIMGGVAPNFVEWANGPGAGKSRDWSESFGKYGVAQLSPWLLWPPDGLNLQQGMRGQLLGYGYLPLPLTTAKSTTAGEPVPTGNQCWTLFLNSTNFKGPVAFFTPFFWSKSSIDEGRFAGQLLDSRPADPNRALQMETQHIPIAQAMDDKGNMYARVTPVQFPCDREGQSTLVHQVTSYNRRALWNSLEAWFAGGPACDGQINTAGSVVHEFAEGAYATWQMYQDGAEDKDKVDVAWNKIAAPSITNPSTFGYQWDSNWIGDNQVDSRRMTVLPEYYRLDNSDPRKPVWTPVRAEEVPAETGLSNFRFDRVRERPAKIYATPDEPESCWKKPGPQAGPFYAELGDGSRLTYYWYRFADQPALLNADLSDEERNVLQARVEQLHRHWKKDRDFLPPPHTGELAGLDPALIVSPPPGMEAGYVPIVTRQEPQRE